jgi:GTP-binding protein HflX
MNLLSKSKVLTEDKLFATLDTTVRKVVIENLPFLLSDTVGFIRKLPTHLVESFKSTLDEVREADVLIHVVDISHPNYEEQIEVVESTLQELGGGDIPIMLVFNKTDAYSYIKKDEDDLTPATKENLSLDDHIEDWNRSHPGSLFISALKKSNINELKDHLYQKVKKIHMKRYPYNDLLY